MKSSNPMGNKEINQKRGPTTGNVATGSKRADFMEEKSTTGSERSKIAGMITDALSARGRDLRSERRVGLENLHTDTNVGRGPTKGNAGKK